MNAGDGVRTVDGVLVGPVRRPYNDLMTQAVGGGHKAIHDEETAAGLGFDGGAPIHGTTHWSQFTPLLLSAFGHEWFESGTLSSFFLTPVAHREPVVAFMRCPAPGQRSVDCWMEKADGAKVFAGTAAIGPTEDTVVQRRLAPARAGLPPRTRLVLARFALGETSARETGCRIDFGSEIGPLFPYTLEQKNAIITEPHPWFERGGGGSPWGRAVLAPEMLNALCFHTSHNARFSGGGHADPAAVGLFGACEVTIVDGPVSPGVDYDVEREIVGLGETKGTEFYWVKTTLFRPGTDAVVAVMYLQQLLLKRSYPGYEQKRAAAEAGLRAKL